MHCLSQYLTVYVSRGTVPVNACVAFLHHLGVLATPSAFLGTASTLRARGQTVLPYLDSTATLAEIKAQFEDTANYDLLADITLCRYHIQACRMLIARTADETRQGSASLRDNSTKYQTALDTAVAWLSANDPDYAGAAGAGSVRILSLEAIRDL